MLILRSKVQKIEKINMNFRIFWKKAHLTKKETRRMKRTRTVMTLGPMIQRMLGSRRVISSSIAMNKSKLSNY